MKALRYRFLGVRIDALLEIFILLFIILGIGAILGIEDRFLHIQPHPFWIVVLLVSAQYGTLEGIIAVVACCLFLYVGNLPTLQSTETIFDYQMHAAILPFLWLLAAFILGQIHDRLTSRMDQTEEKLHQKELEANTITEAYHELKKSKDNLEISLAGQQQTAVTIFKAFRSLESLVPSEIIVNLSDVIITALNPVKFSLYELGAEGLEVIVAHGWKPEDSYARRYPLQHPFALSMMQEPRMLSVVNEEDASLLSDQGVMACPLLDLSNQKVFAVLKIEELNALEFNANTLEIFKSLCELISLSYSNARQFHHMEEAIIHNEKEGIFNYPFFTPAKEELTQLSKYFNLPLSMLIVKLEPLPMPSLFQRDSVEKVLIKLFRLVLPAAAKIYRGKEPSEFLILLPNVSEKEAVEMQAHLFSKSKEHHILQEWQVSIVATSIIEGKNG